MLFVWAVTSHQTCKWAEIEKQHFRSINLEQADSLCSAAFFLLDFKKKKKSLLNSHIQWEKFSSPNLTTPDWDGGCIILRQMNMQMLPDCVCLE